MAREVENRPGGLNTMNLSTMFELIGMVEELCNCDARIIDYVINDEEKSLYVRLSNDKEYTFILE